MSDQPDDNNPTTAAEDDKARAAEAFTRITGLTGQQEMPFALVQGQPMTQLPAARAREQLVREGRRE